MAELTELLITPAPEIERVALAIARDAYPGLDPVRYLRQLEAWATALRPLLGLVGDLEGWGAALARYLYRGLGFRCEAEQGCAPRCLQLNEVMDRRRGTPLGVTVVLMALGRRAGLDVEALGLPRHLLVRLGGASGLVLDPAHLGRRVSASELGRLARQLLPAEARGSAIALGAIDARQVALRLLAALQRAYEQRGEHGNALVVCDRLVDLTNDPRHRRDRGLHALALGANRSAAADLEAYLGAEPDAPDARQIQLRLRQALSTSWQSLQ